VSSEDYHAPVSRWLHCDRVGSHEETFLHNNSSELPQISTKTFKNAISKMSFVARTFGSFLQKSTNVLCNNFLMTSNAIAMEPATNWSMIIFRTHVRNHFPIARESKRIKTHGWKTRMSTHGGRKILMRRILRGRHVLSH